MNKRWTAIVREIRHMELPEAIVYTMAQGYSQEAATDLVMEYQRNRFKPKAEGNLNGLKFTESEFFKRIRERYVR